MSNESRRASRRLGGLALIGAVVAAVVLVPSALSGSTSKTYSAVATSSVVRGTNSASLTFTITNLGSPSLGSANITPTGLANVTATTNVGSVSVVSGVIQLRNLNLSGGSSVTATITADVPCTGTVSWSVIARANGDFTGNTFTMNGALSNVSTSLTGAPCTLVFTHQPNNAEVNTAISETAYVTPPTGTAVTVEARNGVNAKALAANDQVTLTKSAGFFTSSGSFSGNGPLALSSGSVSFPDLKSSATGLDLQLTASATGYTSSTASNAFDVSFDGKNCGNSSTCQVTAPGTHTTVTADGSGTANTNVGVGLLDFNFYTIPSGVCSAPNTSFVQIPGSDGFTESIQTTTGATPDYTITTVFDKTIVNAFPQNGVSAVQACLGAKRIDSVTGLPRTCSQDMTDGLPGFPTVDPVSGDPSVAVCDTNRPGATEAWWGLLPNAGPGINSCDDARLTDPVVLSRTRNSGSGPANAVIKLCKPSPWDGAGGFH